MKNQRWRDEYLVRVSKLGMDLDTALLLLRHAATLQRLAEAQCNGDWPADNGECQTAECLNCGSFWHPSVLKGKDKLCPDCRTVASVKAICKRFNGRKGRLAEIAGFPEVVPIFGGDPRGCVLKLQFPGQDENSAIGVPS